MGQALVLHEAVLARRADGRFVEALGVQFALFQTREFGANQCSPVCECCRTVVCPDRYLLEMRCQRFQVLEPLVGPRPYHNTPLAQAPHRNGTRATSNCVGVVQSTDAAFDAAETADAKSPA